METKINYFTKIDQIAEVIGDSNIVHGTVTYEQPNYVLNGNEIKLDGKKHKSFNGRFKIVDGNLYFASPRKHKFFSLTGEFVCAVITK